MIVAAALGIPATAQAWTAGTDDVGALVVQNNVPADGDLFRIGFIGGDYEIGGITENAHVFGNCAVTSEPNVVHCSPTGITHVAITGSGESGDHDSFLLDRAWDLTSARLPDGVTTTIHLSRGADAVIGSHNRDVIFGGAAQRLSPGRKAATTSSSARAARTSCSAPRGRTFFLRRTEWRTARSTAVRGSIPRPCSMWDSIRRRSTAASANRGRP